MSPTSLESLWKKFGCEVRPGAVGAAVPGHRGAGEGLHPGLHEGHAEARAASVAQGDRVARRQRGGPSPPDKTVVCAWVSFLNRPKQGTLAKKGGAKTRKKKVSPCGFGSGWHPHSQLQRNQLQNVFRSSQNVRGSASRVNPYCSPFAGRDASFFFPPVCSGYPVN